MTPRLLQFIPILLLSAAILRADQDQTAAAVTPSPLSSLNGKYILVDHFKGVIASDFLEFHPDGSCIYDAGGGKRATAKYEIFISSPAPGLAIESRDEQEFYFNYNMILRDHSLRLTTKDGKVSINYVLLPKTHPHLGKSDLVGTFLAHDNSGDCVTQLTPDHKFHLAFRSIDSSTRTYRDFSIAGTWSYTADGVLTYIPNPIGASQEFQSLKAVLVKRDQQGLWAIDPFDNAMLSAKPVKSLDLPPPPPGYTVTHPSD